MAFFTCEVTHMMDGPALSTEHIHIQQTHACTHACTHTCTHVCTHTFSHHTFPLSYSASHWLRPLFLSSRNLCESTILSPPSHDFTVNNRRTVTPTPTPIPKQFRLNLTNADLCFQICGCSVPSSVRGSCHPSKHCRAMVFYFSQSLPISQLQLMQQGSNT